MLSFRHIYLKFILLALISLKAGYFVIENFNSIEELEICCELDMDDVENDGKKELDETEKINQQHSFSFVFDTLKNESTDLCFVKPYTTKYLEYTTPPPEFKQL
ncbi:hypothetical protein [Tenacibaculum sp. IB213877]|uniref:hypothetical protein n=1 Tax=Tenacibaculum sp. IB213877 TaxID=3097351 RepID=UPI002A5A4000|nr:hypothetical protein [Tenacibaculum sp. IB213877]MDY0781197.1 hypothetical protein [Tenacibaculum sp. IB213877]